MRIPIMVSSADFFVKKTLFLINNVINCAYSGAYSHLVKKGSGLSRKIYKQSISKYNLEQKNFNI